MFDTHLLFEHNLREQVQKARERLEEFDETQGNTSCDWTIVYHANDGGSWGIDPPYRYKGIHEMKAAELDKCVDLVINVILASQNSKGLRTLIAGPIT